MESALTQSALIGTRLAPRLGYDAGAMCRDEDGLWTGRWVCDVEVSILEAEAMSDRDAVVALASSGHTVEALELLYRMGELSMDESAGAFELPSLVGFREPWITDRRYIADVAERARERPSINFLREGPGLVVKVLDELSAALTECIPSFIIHGALSAFLQRPFRLSPDIDIVADMPSEAARHQLKKMLVAAGLRITHESRGHLGAVRDDVVPVTVDFDFDRLYFQPSSAIDRAALAKWNGWPLLGLEDLCKFKMGLSRAKDLADLSFLKRE